jgi:hypothetical protein
MEQFSALDDAAKARVLASIVHEETIRARLRYANEPTDVEAQRESLEIIHRLAGYTMNIDRKTASDHASILRMILDVGCVTTAMLTARIEQETLRG